MLLFYLYDIFAPTPLCCGLYIREKFAKDGPKVGDAVLGNSWLAIFGGCFGKMSGATFLLFPKDGPKVGDAVLENSWLAIFGGCFE